ncbi:MAG: hypothetical protein PHP54_03655 [Clostridia bacterium]|nr:hypothetical protein [Clostridia bacterium]
MREIINFLTSIDNWNFIFSVISCLCTILTAIIAFALYDRYGIKGKVKSNRIDSVFDILNFLKKRTMLMVGTNNIPTSANGKLYKGYINFGKEKMPCIYGMEKYKVYFDHQTYLTFSVKLKELLNSIWMPDDIKKCINFILNCGMNIIEYSDMEKENMVIQFSYTKEKNGKVVPVTEYQDYEDFRKSFEQNMEIINNWLKKNNIDIIF